MYEEVDDTVQVISIEAEWQMVSHYQLLYIGLWHLQVISIEAEWRKSLSVIIYKLNVSDDLMTLYKLLV